MNRYRYVDRAEIKKNKNRKFKKIKIRIKVVNKYSK